MELQAKFESLFDAIPEILPSNLTFMEIAGYPHYENVCSNILKFYFNPKTKLHGLDDLLLKSLLQSLNTFEIPFTDFENIIVKREQVTETGRLDLVIYNSRWVIAIENKIRHYLNNDLEEYSKYLNKKFNGHKILKVVLSLRSESNNLRGDFINLTYKDFIKKIEENLLSFKPEPTNQYFVFFIQFIQTIKKMHNTSNMERKEIEFLINNQDKIQQLKHLDNKLNNYISNRAYKIRDAIRIDNNYEKWVYANFDVGFHYKHGNVSYKLECPITRDGISIQLCVEENRIDYKQLKKLDFFRGKRIENFGANDENSKLILEDNIDFFIPDEKLIEKLEDYLAALKISETNEQLN